MKKRKQKPKPTYYGFEFSVGGHGDDVRTGTCYLKLPDGTSLSIECFPDDDPFEKSLIKISLNEMGDPIVIDNIERTSTGSLQFKTACYADDDEFHTSGPNDVLTVKKKEPSKKLCDTCFTTKNVERFSDGRFKQIRYGCERCRKIILRYNKGLK